MKLFLKSLLFIVITSTYSQNTIKGIITDSNSKTPLSYANIYFPEIEKGTSTNENGLFYIDNISSGNHKIIVSLIGYETKSFNINFPITTQIEISLTPSIIEMEAIIVSTPFHKLQSENVMKVEHESIKNLKANGAINLSDGLATIAGIENITTGLSIGKPVIRGLSSNRVLVYAQGVRLENQQFGDEHGLGLSESGTESVEIIKGPASLLYGSDALGGVVYLNPEKFAQNNSSHADFSTNYYSNTKGFNSNAGFKLSGEEFKFLFRANFSQHADYKTKAYRVTNSRFKEQDFKAGIGYQKNKLKTEFRYNVNNSNLGIPEEINIQLLLKTPLQPNQNITNHIFSSKSTMFFEDSRLDINLGYIYNDRKEFEEHLHQDVDNEINHEEDLLEPTLQMKLKTFNYDFKYHLPKVGKFETILGVQGMQQANTNYGEEQLILNATTKDVGILATSHIHLDNIDIQLGARFDNRQINSYNIINKAYNSFNGALGFKTNIAKKTTARLNFATGFRAPNLSELTSNGSHEGTNRYEIGNINLESEQNFQTDLAIEYKNEHVEFFVNGFYNNLSNYIFLSPNGTFQDNNPVFNYQQNNAILYGGETGIHIHPHPLDWLHFESSFETVSGKQATNDFLPLIPANSVTNILRIEFNTEGIKNGYAFIKLASFFKQNNISTFETPTLGYNLLSSGFGGSFMLFKNEINFFVSGTNLTNKAYIHHLSRLKQDGIFNMGRNVTFGLTHSL